MKIIKTTAKKSEHTPIQVAETSDEAIAIAKALEQSPELMNMIKAFLNK